jgi:nascent polypeptide-associated complex subunit alpha
MNPSDLRRQLKKLGIKNVNIRNIESEEVIIRTTDGKEIVAINPQVVVMEVPGANVMIQILATEITERETSIEHFEEGVSEEDAKLVAEQTGASIEEAKEALRETGGDIAAAIMLIEERKKAREGA